MNNAVALEALRLLAERYDVDLSAILAEFANKDAHCTKAVLECVSDAAYGNPAIDARWGFTHTDMESFRKQARENGRIPAIKACRERAQQIEEERRGYKVTHMVMGLKEGKEFITKHFEKEWTMYNADKGYGAQA